MQSWAFALHKSKVLPKDWCNDQAHKASKFSLKKGQMRAPQGEFSLTSQPSHQVAVAPFGKSDEIDRTGKSLPSRRWGRYFNVYSTLVG
jgi:hypothetical protein